jgi:hypothetical protein
MTSLESVFNHLVLPPNLPGRQDPDIEAVADSILTRLLRACDTLIKIPDGLFADTWASIRRTLCVCHELNGGRLEKTSLLREFRNLGLDHLLILHVVEQNAAVLIRRHVRQVGSLIQDEHPDSDPRKLCSNGVENVIFEAFEASPTSEDVLAADNALQWDFPGRAAEIPLSEFLQESFQESLAAFLEQASMESLKRFEARSVKAKVSVIEARDTTDPALVTQMLMPLLEALGAHAQVPRLRKRVRDDVNIQTAELPWRRLPFWLILRVATQRQLCLALGNETGHACYKFLICTVLAQLLEDCAGQLVPELIMTLRAKLCRRLAKLEMDKTRVDPSPSAAYKEFFSLIGPKVKRAIEMATEKIDVAWANFKREIARPVHKLPLRAEGSDGILSLQNSGEYLHNLLTSRPAEQTGSALMNLPLVDDDAMEKVKNFTDRYFKLASIESKTEGDRQPAPDLVTSCRARCLELANSITDFFTVVGSSYDSNPEEMSTFILNIFHLWVQMDECTVKATPILREYHPIFSPELLDVLQLPTLSSMRRLQAIQNYLRERCGNCRLPRKNIFSEPDKDCFAAQYLAASNRLQKLQQKIENASSRSRGSKESEWVKACNEYDDLCRLISEGTCVCSFNPDGTRNVKGCKKCWRCRCRKRMNISVHEDFLPENSAQMAAVVFELGIPSYLAAYRNVTWRILRDLGHPSRPHTSIAPVMQLKDYTQLQGYMESTPQGLSLASIKKSFLQTHFKGFKMKVKLSNIILPLGLDFSLYDFDSGIWLKDLKKPLTFQHLCGIHIPRGLEVSIIPPSSHPPANNNGPSSYEILASQTECPQGMSVYEFTAYQRLLSGKFRRWPTMLVELGSRNLNFSNEDTMKLFGQLAVQAGPRNITEPLRETHLIFKEKSFCERLAEQINNRLSSIISNWRETHCMEILITLSLRLFSLTSGTDRQSAESLLKTARSATLGWISCLRDEVRSATEADSAERAAMYGFWAALLCRRTFATYAESNCNMDAGDLCSFIQASIALQENLVVDLKKLPLNLENMLVRDIKMTYHIESLIQQSIQSHPSSLGAAIISSWSDSSKSVSKTFSPWRFLGSQNPRWVFSIVTTTTDKFTYRQGVHYNFVEGHLLLDGKPLGRLPLNIRNSEDVKELFEQQHLRTYPSSLTGMTHRLANTKEGHDIHFGLRREGVVIRAFTKDGLLEYVPRHVFTKDGSFDLPLSLIENCVHWLNLDSQCLEIRRRPVIWKTRPGDWKLNILDRRAWRRDVCLIDPYSDLSRRVSALFRHFEVPERLTIFQPPNGKLAVELRYLELSFFVNKSNLLECRELNAEFDPNQDAGTLYGLQSKIVLRDKSNPKRRSIIIPLGQSTKRTRDGMHVAVRVDSSNEFGRFEIDDVLGRLSCPPEPRLLYSKALFHAFTSFVLPDPLTGRTGTEEALHILRSGSSQPWMPLSDIATIILKALEKLSPSREYYPRDKKRLQTVTWDQTLTSSIQHDSYEPLVQEIFAKSNRIKAFVSFGEKILDIKTPSHLRRRGEIRRLLYERHSSDSDQSTPRRDKVYQSRDQKAVLSQATNVYQIVRLIRARPFSIRLKRSLRAILQGWKLIGGFNGTSEIESNSLNNLSEDNIGEQWGSLVNFCRHTDSNNIYRLIFRLALLSFGQNPDMDVIRSLAAFGCLDELKVLETPAHSSFVEFEPLRSPKLELLQALIATAYFEFKPNFKQKRGRRDADRENYQMVCESDGARLASLILGQWPSSDPSTEGFQSTSIDIELAMEKIFPEWERLRRNLELSEYIDQVQRVLDRYKGAKDKSVPLPSKPESPVFGGFHRESVIPSLSGDLLIKRGPPPSGLLSIGNKRLEALGILRGLDSPKQPDGPFRGKIPPKEALELGKILDSFARSPDPLRRQYVNDLKRSLTALRYIGHQPMNQGHPPAPPAIRVRIEEARAAVSYQFKSIANALSADDGRSQWLELGSIWPCVTPITILELLRSSSNSLFGSNMREALVSYGVLITNLQWLGRIEHAYSKYDQRKLAEEWRNQGHENWSPLHFPDWLLLEIDSNILIRSEQIDVAHEIISPSSKSNSVLQMNMGKGKYTPR